MSTALDNGNVTTVPSSLETYLKVTTPMPGLMPAPTVDLTTLMQARLEIKDRSKVAAAKKVGSAQSEFRRYAIHLIKSITDAAQQHRNRVMLTVEINMLEGNYGATIFKDFGSKESRQRCRVIMADPDAPYLVRFAHEKSNGHTYDLGSMVPHGSPIGFVRPYSGLLEDLAAWVVDGVA